MTSGRELEAAFARCGLKKSTVAKHLGISLNSLRRKTVNQCDFKMSEVKKLSELLALSDEEVRTIFFA